MSKISYSEYEGNKLIVLGDPEDRFKFQFGVSKAQKLLDVLRAEPDFADQLEKFIADNKKAKTPTT